MQIMTKHPLLDELLSQYQTQLGTDATAYRNHCYRVFNFYRAFMARNPENLGKGGIAIGVNDLGIWTHKTLDYLDPSIELATDYLTKTDLVIWTDDICAMIDNHHKVTVYPNNILVESLRKADWIDVSLGALHFGLSRPFIEAVQKAFPNAGFHQKLVRLSLSNVIKHPLKPLPIFKW
ncbi:MAG: phosphohydrolase [Moraxellaceae bacterium]|nr:phosphohydrolase [Moraxellaceae bacterium]